MSIDAVGDGYWSRHQDFFHDPLIVWLPELSYSNLMAEVRFADLTAAIVNARLFPLGDTFTTMIAPDLSRTRILIRNCTDGAAIAGAPVKVWKVRPFYPYEYFLMVNTNSNADGIVEFQWTDPAGDFGNYNQLILIKAYAPNGLESTARWATTTEAMEAKMLRSQPVFEIPIFLGAPRLAIERLGDGLVLSWPAPGSNYVLQAQDALGQDGWTSVSAQPILQGGNLLVAFPATNDSRFFRLVRTPLNTE